jgi:hypothetical protein
MPAAAAAPAPAAAAPAAAVSADTAIPLVQLSDSSETSAFE